MKVATPFALLTSELVVARIDELPDPWSSRTTLPDTGLPVLSFNVTVMVTRDVPLSVALPELTATVDSLAETAPPWKLTIV